MLNLENFSLGQLQNFKTFLLIMEAEKTPIRSAINEIEEYLFKNLPSLQVEKNTLRIPVKNCPDCETKMRLKQADEDQPDLTFWECPKCLKSIFEGKTIRQIAQENR